jgi:hypothetical protein
MFRRFGDAHHVVVRKRALAAEMRERQNAAAAASLHQRYYFARQRDQRVRAHVERYPEPLAAGLDEWVFQLGPRCEGRAVNEEVETAELAFDVRHEIANLPVVADVTWAHQRALEARGKIADVLLEPFPLIGQGQPRAGGSSCLRNGPRNRSLVGDPDDEAVFSSEIGHTNIRKRDCLDPERQAVTSSASARFRDAFPSGPSASVPIRRAAGRRQPCSLTGFPETASLAGAAAGTVPGGRPVAGW